jgi:hypothetical protein
VWFSKIWDYIYIPVKCYFIYNHPRAESDGEMLHLIEKRASEITVLPTVANKKLNAGKTN